MFAWQELHFSAACYQTTLLLCKLCSCYLQAILYLSISDGLLLEHGLGPKRYDNLSPASVSHVRLHPKRNLFQSDLLCRTTDTSFVSDIEHHMGSIGDLCRLDTTWQGLQQSDNALHDECYLLT